MVKECLSSLHISTRQCQTTQIPIVTHKVQTKEMLNLASTLLFILGFGGNSLVITVMSRKKQKRSIPRLFILNLAFSDLSFIMIATPINIYSYISTIYQNSYYCRLLTPLLTIFYFGSIFTIFSMAVHRCRLITNPYRPKMRMRNAYIWIVAIWFSSLIIVLPL